MIQIRSRKSAAVKVIFAVICLIVSSMLWSNSVEAASPIKMKFAWPATPKHPWTSHAQEWVKELSEASNGTVVIDFYGAEALGKAPEYWDIVTEGLADMALFSCAYNPARFQLTTFFELPFFSTNAQTSYDVGLALWDKQLITKEFGNIKPLMISMSPPSQIFSNKKISNVNDFKGRRLFGATPVSSKSFALLGAQSVSMSMQDVYLALERKTLDAGITNWTSVMGYRWIEVVKYPIDISLMGGYFHSFIMNGKSWNKLSPEVQEAWTKICEKYGHRFIDVMDKYEAVGRKRWPDAGKPIEKFPAEEKEKLAVILAPVWQDWIDRMEKAGKPGKEVYKTYVEILKKKGEPVVIKVPGLYEN